MTYDRAAGDAHLGKFAPGWWRGDCEELLVNVLEENANLEATLAKIEAIQPAAMAMFRKQGIVFDRTGGQWEDVAFALYTDLCEINLLCRQALEEVDDK